MATVLLDTCIILDILDPGNAWHQWSKDTLRELRKSHSVVINPIIFSELCTGMASPEETLVLLHSLSITEKPLTHEALFLAAKAFLQYRRKRGKKTGVLPDFFIGAQAAVADWSLVSRDKGRFSSYFPTVQLIMPGSH
ncbi:MAG: type II toxin-antitoxin system VapC family toxin [Endozoicomonas sp.]